MSFESVEGVQNLPKPVFETQFLQLEPKIEHELVFKKIYLRQKILIIQIKKTMDVQIYSYSIDTVTSKINLNLKYSIKASEFKNLFLKVAFL